MKVKPPRPDRIWYALDELFTTLPYENASVTFGFESNVRDGETIEAATERVSKYVEGVIRLKKRQRRIDVIKEGMVDRKLVKEYKEEMEKNERNNPH